MAEETPTNGASDKPATQTAPKMRILGQYIRDLSFENIVARKGIQQSGKPDVQVQVNLDARKRDNENEYEVLTKFNVTSKTHDPEVTLYVLELEYSGIFHVENVPEEQLHPFLLIECPRQLFPFVRRIVSDVTQDGGFPGLNLENIDFVALYRQGLAQRQQQKTEDQTTPTN
ncbi:protein translocase subunit secB [Tranquillimonas rosea]|uniref:Protein-export protein SecB n=1 Tax=Tranquillimonas rosea TaxID=641238 RepID=A0A1H9UF10_9RHOB|nr:protein-export chaperone SecB [Tranquillimonas rosea]SES07939.1 protein translocase subunit secB [Tranquillimonas rosea]